METPLDNKAQNRARLSLRFGLIWVMIPLIWLSLRWLINGPLEPLMPGSLSQAGIAIDRIISILEKTGFILWVGSGVACVITALPQPNPRSWQSRTAVLLAFLVLVTFLPPAFCLLIWYFP